MKIPAAYLFKPLIDPSNRRKQKQQKRNRANTIQLLFVKKEKRKKKLHYREIEGDKRTLKTHLSLESGIRCCFGASNILQFHTQSRRNRPKLEPQALHQLLNALVLWVHNRVFLHQLLHLPDRLLYSIRESSRVDLNRRVPDVDATIVKAELLPGLETHLQAHLLALLSAGDKAVFVGLRISFLEVRFFQIQRGFKDVLLLHLHDNKETSH
jgi:hypothetical protein